MFTVNISMRPVIIVLIPVQRIQFHQLFRKDLISAMKLPDSEPLTSEDFWGIGDPWRQEWERGVQVPVNPNSLPTSHFVKIKHYPRISKDFSL